MSEAKAMKLKEYGTSVISHDLSYATNSEISTRHNVRTNDTFKSRVMDAVKETVELARLNNKTAEQVHAKSRDRLFNEMPLAAKVQRTSYQDSNIFGYKDQDDITVQNSAKRQQAGSRLRNTATYQSRVFDALDGSYKHFDEAVRTPSTTRLEVKWQSTVFDGPIIEEVHRKRLGQKDAGQESLFGKDRVEYQSSNVMSSVSGRKTFMKTFVPVRQQKTAEQRKQEEVYGKSAQVHGVNKRSDGTLMADNADWRNPHQTHTNSPIKKSATQA